jgi:hypothetical protein
MLNTEELKKVTGSFKDSRVIMWQAGKSSAIGACTSEYGITAQQSEDTPIYLCLGKYAPDDACLRAANKYGFNVSDVLAFRDKQDYADDFID